MSYQFKNITVLIVESSESMFSLTRNVLMTFGVHQVYSAFDADEGFKTFCQINPDLVITDWLEGNTTGLDLTKKIRANHDSPNPFVPIILMTGYSQKRRVMKARDSGITEFLVKPFTAKALYQRLEHMIEKPRSFIKCDSYFGPDRRRKRDGDYAGPERRTDMQTTPATTKPSELARRIKENQDSR